MTRRSSTTASSDRSHRRWLRFGGISHATVVAYLALFMATSGAAFAATGGTFVLGKANSASTVTSLSNSGGSALSLSSPSGVAPLRVNRTAKVVNLNADLLDGRDSTGFLRLGTGNSNGARTGLANPNGIPLRLTPKAGSAPMTVDSKVRVTNLNADLLDGKDSTAFATSQQIEALEARVAQLETLLASVSLETVNGQPTVRFSGVNVQVVNGTGQTFTKNGRGNLIVGYDHLRHNLPNDKSGSHYLVVGDKHNYTRWGGAVIGAHHTASGEYASVVGGADNIASGPHTAVLGGRYNQATFNFAAAGGGYNNKATGLLSTALGGKDKTVSVDYACHPAC